LLFIDLPWLDPLVSVLIGLLIVVSSGRVLKESVHILAEGMPDGMTASIVAKAMHGVPGVNEVHNLHVWTVAPGYIALSAHVTVADSDLSQTKPLIKALKKRLHDDFEIDHTTIQLECWNCGQGTVPCL
jgi:cobalt-zinc-cadmium efflux system protein